MNLDLLKYKHKSVRDLAWVLSSPPLFFIEEDFIFNLDQTWFDHQFQSYQNHLEKLDQNPKPLLNFIEKYPIQRLGFYFEALWLYWGNTNNSYKIIHHNLNIEKNKKTIGSLDFILKEKISSKKIHLEVCVKFYLGFHHQWHGPNQKDRLDLKYNHLKNHQIPLGKVLDIQEAWFFSKGMLFYHSEKQNQDHLNPDHLKSWWMTVEEFHRQFDDSDIWKELPKSNWLSPNYDNEIPTENLNSLELIKYFEKSNHDWIKISKIEKNREVKRYFIVNSDWINNLK